MATTMYFEETIKDQGGSNPIELEFGSSSYFPEVSLYLKMGDKTVIVDRETAKRIIEAFDKVGDYLSL